MNQSAKLEVGERLKHFRESLKMSQVQLADALEGGMRGIQDNELGRSLPNSKVLIGLHGLGLNVNWLLSGKGPMLLADLQKPTVPKINVEAMAKAFEVMMQTAKPGETLAQTARKAVEFYVYLIETGKITPEGIGNGNLNNAA